MRAATALLFDAASECEFHFRPRQRSRPGGCFARQRDRSPVGRTSRRRASRPCRGKQQLSRKSFNALSTSRTPSPMVKTVGRSLTFDETDLSSPPKSTSLVSRRHRRRAPRGRRLVEPISPGRPRPRTGSPWPEPAQRGQESGRRRRRRRRRPAARSSTPSLFASPAARPPWSG